MKKFLALLMALTLSLSMAVPAFATGVAEDADVSAGVVVYEDENFVVYDMRSDATAASPRAMTYGNKWFEASNGIQNDDFTIQVNIREKFGVTFGIESSSTKSSAGVYLNRPDGKTVMFDDGTAYCELGNVDGRWVSEVKKTVSGQPTGTWTVKVGPVKAVAGTRVMCWIYDA